MNTSAVKTAALIVLGTVAIGCGGGAASGPGANTPGAKRNPNNIVAEAKNKFDDGLKAMSAHDKANDWSAANCESTAELFKASAEEQQKSDDRTFAEAIYNAGLAYQRCKDHDKAKEQFNIALKANPAFHRARAQLALYAFVDSGEKSFDGPIAELERAIKDASFQNVDALVNLAMIQMRRNNNVADKDGANDFDRAKLNLQRALAIDDGFMPAFNQLAVYYLESAKAKAGVSSKKSVAGKSQKRVDAQALELAALVCSQAIRKNPNFAPIHNTAGMIQVELRNLNTAVSEFNTARRLDPTFYEAQMNYAAVNLQFRGFAQAEEAFRAALKMRPNDFDAHLGLALAIRGQISDANFDKFVQDASNELAAARKVAPERPETYYNEAILTQEYKSKAGGKAAEGALNAAKALFNQFIQKAGSAPEFADAVKGSKDRMSEIDQILEFNKQTEAEQKLAEQEQKQREAEAETSGALDPNAKPADAATP